MGGGLGIDRQTKMPRKTAAHTTLLGKTLLIMSEFALDAFYVPLNLFRHGCFHTCLA